MEIIMKKVSDLIPYKNNPRRNDTAVEYVANSIREFGFKVPIIIDKNNVIAAGHTRVKAAKKLRMKEVPCIIADDLTDEQIKAFRLADNKVAESAAWDDEALDKELSEILDFDMSDFGFDMDFVPGGGDDEGYYGDERQRTGDAYNLGDYDQDRAVGFYQTPVIKPDKYVPDDLIGFNYVLSSKRRDAGVHFFVDDYQFERIWNDPYTYIAKLEEFPCALTPDFSLYLNMPMAMKIWNVYRSRLIGQMMQDAGMRVIPTLSWAEPETFQFCFDGLSEGGTVAVSTVGVMRDAEAQRIWSTGMDEALKRLKPSTVLCYGTEIDYDFGSTPVKYFKARRFN